MHAAANNDENADANQDAGEKKNKRPVKWSDEEERLFLEGLELYGREWDKVCV
jgi:hypothetical protein